MHKILPMLSAGFIMGSDISIVILVAVCNSHLTVTHMAPPLLVLPRNTHFEVFQALMELFIHHHRSLIFSSVITHGLTSMHVLAQINSYAEV